MFYLTIQTLLLKFDVLDPALISVESIFKSRFPSFYSPQSALAPSIHITFESADDCPILNSDIEKNFSWKRDQALWGMGDDPLYLTDGYSTVISEIREKRIRFYLHPRILSSTYFLARTFLLIPILDMLRTYNLHYLHAALVTKGDKSLLIMGQGGAGKSTLSAALVRKGWRWVSDDNLLLEVTPNKILCIALEQDISLHPDLAQKMNLVGHMEKGKVRISHSSIQSFMTKSATPTHIILLDNVSIHEPLSKSELLHRLLGENPVSWISKDRMQSHLGAYQKLLQHTYLSKHSAEWSRADEAAQTLRLD